MADWVDSYPWSTDYFVDASAGRDCNDGSAPASAKQPLQAVFDALPKRTEGNVTVCLQGTFNLPGPTLMLGNGKRKRRRKRRKRRG